MNFALCFLIAFSLIFIGDAFSYRSSAIRSNIVSKTSVKYLPATALFSTQDNKEADEPVERQMSDTMKSKLMKEIQNNAGDPNFSQGPILGNPILIISIVISVLAVSLKAKGYL